MWPWSPTPWKLPRPPGRTEAGSRRPCWQPSEGHQSVCPWPQPPRPSVCPWAGPQNAMGSTSPLPRGPKTR
eukprot:346460-Lingulodinium_polyedra.AAC.1